jgi:hypothetical protein
MVSPARAIGNDTGMRNLQLNLTPQPGWIRLSDMKLAPDSYTPTMASFIRLMSIALAILLTATSGCGRKSTHKTEGGEVTVDRKSGQITYEGTSKEGKVKVASNQAGVPLPDNFPKDVPIYQGATVQMAAAQGKTSLVHLQTTATVAECLKYYQDALKEQGWTIESTMNMGDSSMLAAKKEKRQCAIVVHKQDKGSLIQVSIEDKE